MAELTYSDVQTRVANDLRIPTSDTQEMTKLQNLINAVYRDIAVRYPNWWWLRKRQLIATSDDISTGTVSVTNNNTAITFSSAPTPSIAGRVFYVVGNTTDSGAIYRVSSHTAATTAATLDGVYTGATDTAAGYRVYQDTYDLATDTNRVIYVQRWGYRLPLEIISPEQMREIKGYDVRTGKPQLAAISDFDTTGDPTTQKQLILHPYPDAIYRLELDYTRTLNTEVSSTTRFLIPDDYIQVLVYGTLSRAYPIYKNDAQRGAYFLTLFNDVLALMVAHQRTLYEGFPQTIPADTHRSFYRKGRRISPSTVDLGDAFGRWPAIY